MATAYADESLRLTGPEPMYLLGATVFASDPTERVSELVRQKTPGAPKMHWREMGRSAQARSLLTVASTDATTTVVVATPMRPKKQERARRKCLEALLPMLEAAGVDLVVMESRNPTQDARDVGMADIMKTTGAIGQLRVIHKRGEEEPRLWYPDLLLGAYGDMLCEERLPDNLMAAWAEVEGKTYLQVVSA